jgi:hypothetical protein
MILPESQVRQLFKNVAAATGQPTRDLMHDVMGLWAKSLVRETYPKKPSQGKKAVATDALKLFSTIERMESEGLKERFKKNQPWDIPTSQLFFRPHMKDGEIKSIIRGKRNRSGRVPGRSGQGRDKIIVRQAQMNKYIRDAQKRVGRLKAGWLAVLREHSFTVPAWVRNHGSSESEYVGKRGVDPVSLRGEMVITNKVPYADSKLGGQFMAHLVRLRVRDLEKGFYAKRWQKKTEAEFAKRAVH